MSTAGSSWVRAPASMDQQNGNSEIVPPPPCPPREAVRVLPFLGKYLSLKTRKSIRLVSKAWKRTVDTGFGVSLEITDRRALSHDSEEIWKWNFIRYVAIEETSLSSVMNEAGTSLVLKHPAALRTVRCTGPDINPLWFSQELLLKCPNLTKLVLTGGFLLSQDLTGLEASLNYEGLLVLPSLKDFQVQVNYMELREQLGRSGVSWMGLETAMLLSLGLTDASMAVPTSTEEKKRLHHMMLHSILDCNMAVLLSSFRSPCLQALYILIDWLPEFGFEPHPFSWKFRPLESFIAAHRATLKRLFLPDFGGKFCLDHKERLLPERLDSLELSLCAQAGTKQSFEVWEKLIQGQEKLSEAHLELHFPEAEEWYKGPLLGLMLDKNSPTLTYLNIGLSHPDLSLTTIDCCLFRGLNFLQTLVIQESPFPSRVINLPLLPKSLLRLQIYTRSVLKTMEWERLRLLRSLETLHLRRIFRVDHVTDHPKVSRFLKEMLRMRRLSSLKVHFEQPLVGKERTKMLVKILKRLRPDEPEWEDEVKFIVLTPAETKKGKKHFFELNSVRRVGVEPRYDSWAETVENLGIPTSDLLVESNVFQRETGLLGTLMTSMILNS